MAGRKTKEFISKHIRYFIVGGLFLILVAVLIVILVRNKDKSESSGDENASEAVESSIEVPKDKYEVDKYPEVNNFLKTYYDAIAAGNVDAIASMSNTLSEDEQIRIQKTAEYYSGFSNYKVYTKKGPAENSYLAFVTYDIMFKGANTPAPALATVYLCTNSNGELYVNKEDLTEDEKAYILALASQADSSKLCDEVEVEYNKVLEKDEALAQLAATMKSQINEQVKEELAKSQQAAAEAAAQAEAEAQAAAQAEAATTVQATDTVNIRASASTEADILGKSSVGDTFTRYEEMDNGWSKIDYNGTEAYIKSEYLKEVAASGEGSPESQESTGPSTAPGGKITVKENVNIRETASETGNKLGVAYRGEQYELVENANGWCKIKYDGKEAYVKADFVE